MNRLVVYRNCFTGDVSGGDMHMSGLLSWVLDNRPSTEAVLVLPRRDGQEKVYPEVARIKTITHPDTKLQQSIALMYVARALKAASKVNKFLEGGDVLVASSHFLPDVLPVALARAGKDRKVVFIHHIIQDMGRPDSISTKLANLQEKLCLGLIRRFFGKVVVVNQMVADRLRQMGFSKQQILISSNFVQPLAYSKPYDQKSYDVAFCGRMVRQKGVDDFLYAVREIGRDNSSFRAVMIGVGPELARLKAEVASQKLPIDMIGYADDATKFELLSQAKLFVFPSVEEGWGIAIAEALSVGTPVIAYDLPVYGPIFDEHVHTGALHNRVELVQKAKRLLDSFASSPVQYRAEQERITAYAERFRLDQVAARESDFIGA